MRRVALLLGVAALAAGCGGKHTTRPANTASAPVTKVVHGIDLVFKGGTASIDQLRNKQTAVSVKLDRAAAPGTKAELDRGSCGAPAGLQVAKPLGTLSGRTSSWSVTGSWSQLTSSPLAFVLRSKAGKLVACGQAHGG